MTGQSLDHWAELDPSFRWSVARTFSSDRYHGWVLELVSQTWVDPNTQKSMLWKHWLTITVPKSASSKTAFLHIGGGLIHDLPPAGPNERFLSLALTSGTVVAELWQVPNQPLRTEEGAGRLLAEDALIARLLSRFSGDDRTLPRYPMVRSAVAAMTAVQECLSRYEPEKNLAERFVVSGSSKRGWAAWLVGLADPRVAAIIPVVINIVNVQACVRHHWDSLGFFSEALRPYVDEHLLPDEIAGPKLSAAIGIEDPFSYLAHPRMTIPKLIVVASGDEYFPCDSTRHYYSKLPGPKFLRVLPNSPHSPADTDVNETIAAWHTLIAHNCPLPKYIFDHSEKGFITLQSDSKPARVGFWQANNPHAQDFRVDTLGAQAFRYSEVSEDFSGRYYVEVPQPRDGFTACFMEAKYEHGGGCLSVTSEVCVTPDILPFRRG